MIHNLLNTYGQLYIILGAEGNTNLENLDNHPLDLYTSSDHYVQHDRIPGNVQA
jgi:hypothetical protein